jgi:hypothetical protein
VIEFFNSHAWLQQLTFPIKPVLDRVARSISFRAVDSPLEPTAEGERRSALGELYPIQNL